MNKHFVLILNVVEETKSCVQVLGVFHCVEDAKKAFKDECISERIITESNNYAVIADTDDRYEVCVPGYYNNEHRLLFIAEA